MVWRTWRGLLRGCMGMLLLAGPATTTLAQTPSPATHPTPAKTAAKPASHVAAAKPSAAKKIAQKHEPAVVAKKLATAKAKPPEKKLAAARKPVPEPKIAAAKKPAEPAKLAAVAAKPEPPSYTITTTRDNVVTTATRIVPLPAAVPATMTMAAAPAPVASAPKPEATQAAVTMTAVPAPTASADTKPAVIPVSLTRTVASAAPASFAAPAVAARSFAAMAATTMAPARDKPAAQALPATAATQPAAPKAAAAFVSAFLTEAFHIAKADNANSLQRRARLADLFAGKMDVKRIAGYTTSNELTGVSADIQQRFRTILVSYLVETYYPQLELASDPSVAVETSPVEALPDGTAVVWTTFTKDGWGSQSIKWHLVSDDGQYKIVDIFSAGASLVQMERDTFRSVMRNGGLNELMAKLDQRTKELATAATE